MREPLDVRPTTRVVIHVLAGVCLLGLAGVAVASESGGGEASPVVESFHSIAHLFGIAVGLALIYFGYETARTFAGGAIGDSGTYVAGGAGLYVLAFGLMELEHGLGIHVLGFVPGKQLHVAIHMFLFTGTMFLFGYGYYRIASVLEGGVE